MTEAQTITFVIQEGGARLDQAIVAHLPNLSRAQVQQLIKSGAATVNGQPARPAIRVRPGDQVSIALPEEQETAILPEPIPLDIVYEDADLLAVNKPAGMVVHPATGHTSGTLVNGLLAYCPQLANVGGPERAGIVHRLDKETSGLLLVAKTDAARAALQRQFKHRQVQKTYLALVEGQVQPREGIIEAPVGRDRKKRKQMAVTRTGRPAVTQYRVKEIFRSHTLLEVRPHTGRTHQVRVHLAWLGYPLVGDRVYGQRRQRLLPARHFLHACELQFTHPATGQDITLTAPLPPELAALLKQLRGR